MSEPEDKSYTVEDRRFLHMSEEEKAKVREEEAAKAAQESAGQEAFEEAAQKAAAAGAGGAQEVPIPEINFSSFLFSLSSSAFVHLGMIPDPDTGKTQKNLALAKHTIDLLGMLREKTRNNLIPEEEVLFDHLLYDLRMVYVKEVG